MRLKGNIKSFNRYWLVLYALFAGCFYAMCLLCTEAEMNDTELLINTAVGIALMLGCGYPLCKLAKKWEKEGKVKI